MSRLLAGVASPLALAVALVAPASALAQLVTGSAVAPSTANNSAERPFRFVAQAAEGGALVIPMADATLPALQGVAIDAATGAAISRAIAAADFKGGRKDQLALRGLGNWSEILLVGTGPLTDEKLRSTVLREAGGRAAQALVKEKQTVTVALPAALGDGATAAEVVLGYALGQYRFDKYKSDRTAPPADAVTFVSADARAVEAQWQQRLSPAAQGVLLARDLSAEPANVIYPESFVERVRAAFAGVQGVTIEVLDERAMTRLNMGALLGVGQGAPRPPRLMVVSYRGANAPQKPLAFVGKGITFDSGGISIKPGGGMSDMKMDMAGAASAMGAVLSLAKSRAPVNVVSVAALAENMPGGNAQRPGDVVRSMSGKTIEVLNTDAEGRLVLADGVEYVEDRYKPGAIVTIATLTGAAVRALDDEYSALLSRDDKLVAAIESASIPTNEAVWRLPLHENYLTDMKSSIADIKNVVEGGGPGAGHGAQFVAFFVKDGTPFAHLDVAGTAWTTKGNDVTPKGPTAVGVRLLDELARNWKN